MSGQNVMGRNGPRIAIVTRSLANTAEGRYVNRLVTAIGSNRAICICDSASAWVNSRVESIPCALASKTALEEVGAAADRVAAEIVHLICSQPFFPAAAFSSFVQSEHTRGRRIVAEVRTPQIVDENLVQCLRIVDAVIANDSVCEFELIAAGVPASKILRLGCGIALVSPSEKTKTILGGMGVAPEQDFMFLPCSLPADESVERLLEAAEKSTTMRFFVAPLVSPRWDSQATYFLQDWQQLAERHGKAKNIRFLPRTLTAEETAAMVVGAQAVVFSSPQPHEEIKELLVTAFENAKAVLSPPAYPFAEHSTRVFSFSNRFAPRSALVAIAESAELRRTLGEAGKKWARTHAFEDYSTALTTFYDRLLATAAPVAPVAPVAPGVPVASGAPVISAAPRMEVNIQASGSRTKQMRAPRILMQNRTNAYTQPGGDTVVMDRVTAGLRARGIEVAIDLEGKCDPRQYDLVHLFNFALKDQTEQLARRCHQTAVPFVVTTMYEDWPIFFSQMNAQYSALQAYVQGGQNRAHWSELSRQAKMVPPSPIWDNSITANYASALIATGESEARALKRDYPATKRVEIYHCGGDFSDSNDGGELFYRQTGLKDFILCVGRFELRKNQLMLLKAFEDSEMPLVFAGGGFTYQPEYLEVCKRFQRKGKTVFLDRLEPAMLASAFQAARVHVLPSWLELPGIVSLEAAWFGRNVVVTGYGTERDYFGNFAFYCSPDSPESIFNATMAAFHAPVNPELKARVSGYTWERAAERNMQIYRDVLQGRDDLMWNAGPASQAVQPARVAAPTDPRLEQTIQTATFNARRALHSVGMIPAVVGEEMDDPKQTESAQKLCIEGDEAAARRDLREAFSLYQRAATTAPRYSRAFRSCGAIVLAEGNPEEAERWFEQAIAVNASDARALVGISMLKWNRGEKESAYIDCIRANQSDPDDAVTILQLVRMSYEMDRLKELEDALRTFLKNDPNNVDMLYCLAGCSFKRKRNFLARGVIERILRIKPDHEGALELRDCIAAEVTGDEPSHLPSPSAKGAVQVTVTGRDMIANQIQALETAKRDRNFDEAMGIADELLAGEELSDEQRCYASILRAEIEAVRGDTGSAEEIFRRYLHHSNWGYRAHAGLGAVCAEKGSWLEAQDLFERALRLFSTCDTAIAGLGVCAQQAGKFEQAWNYFEQALQLNPENLRALYGMVQLGYELKRLERTSQVLETYLEMHPVDLSMMYSFAGCCYALKQVDRAEEEARKILIFEPAHALARELIERIESDRRQGRVIT